MKSIAAAMVKAQKGFAPALKTSTNPHFRSKYADLAACVEAVIDSLNNAGIALVQRTSECETGVVVETIFVHESGEVFEAGKLHVPAAKNDPQGYGSALTYARRYSLMAACGIAPEDDDGNHASKPRQSSKPVTTDVWDSLPIEEREFLQGIADEVMAAPNDQTRVAILGSKHLDADEKVALWSRFDSKTRADIKKAQETFASAIQR